MKNLEISFLAYTRITGYQLEEINKDSDALVERLKNEFEAGNLDEGSQVYDFKGTSYLIDVQLELNEIQVQGVL